MENEKKVRPLNQEELLKMKDELEIIANQWHHPSLEALSELKNYQNTQNEHSTTPPKKTPPKA